MTGGVEAASSSPETTADQVTFRVYALHYAHREAVRAEHFYGHDPCGDQPMPMDCFVWVAVSSNEVLAADASHYEANIADDRPFSIVHTLPPMYDAFDRVRELADSPDLVVPGHDPAVFERFPAVPSSHGGTVVSIA